LTKVTVLVIVNREDMKDDEMVESKCNILYTIGHSNHKIEDFIALLNRYEVTCIADVRSAPYSRYCPQFNKDALATALQSTGITYMFLGRELGARSDAFSCYERGCVNFQHIAETEEFKGGLQRLIAATSEHQVALMCAEKEPLECHRSILICRHLKEHNLCIRHILQDGRVEDHLDTERRLVKMLKIEPTLFEPSNTERDIIEQAYDRQAQKISYQPEELKESYERAE
jgi:uncharacterized protein (DUF488 family)